MSRRRISPSYFREAVEAIAKPIPNLKEGFDIWEERQNHLQYRNQCMTQDILYWRQNLGMTPEHIGQHLKVIYGAP